MEKMLNKIIENNALFIGVIIGLSVILIVLIVLIVRSLRANKKINIYEEELEDEDIKKVKNVKKEDIIETPDEKEDNIKEKKKVETKIQKSQKEDDMKELEEELEEKYSDEYKKEIEEVKEENINSSLASIISKMESDSKMKPEDVVANFEKEQEAQSIISYKELVKAVKNRQEDYEDELESKPLKTVSTLMEEIENNQSEEVEEEEISKEKQLETTQTTTKFRNTDVISPVFGRVNQDNTRDLSNTATIDLSDIELSDLDFVDKKNNVSTNDVAMAELDKIYNKMADDLKKNEGLEDSKEVEKLTRNEEFLQSLKDFRNKL